MSLPGSEPTPADIDKLAQSGIPAEVVKSAMIRRVDSVTGSQLVGRNGTGDYAGLLYPYILPGDHPVREFRLRRDCPDLERKPDGSWREKAKYLTPRGQANMAYFPPGTAPEHLSDTSVPVFVTEGEKKALALSALAMTRLVIGLAGVWNWRGTIGKTTAEDGGRRNEVGVIPDLERVVWKGREVTIIFDSNVRTNGGVKAARRELANELKRRGANVRVVDLPEVNGCNGVVFGNCTWPTSAV